MPGTPKTQGLLSVEIDSHRRSLVVKARVNGQENAQTDIGHAVVFSERSASKVAAALADELVVHMAALLRRQIKDRDG